MIDEIENEENENKEKERFTFKKPDFAVIKQTASKPIVKSILSNTYMGLLCYAVIFIIGEILVSGGKSERNPYFVIAMVIFLVAAQIIFIPKRVYNDLKSVMISAVTVTLIIALLDYLIINLAFDRNNLIIYKYWPMYFIYLTTLALPFIRSNWSKINLPNLKLLLTKQERTL